MSHPDRRLSSLFAFLGESAAIRREYEATQSLPCSGGCGRPVHLGACWWKTRPGDMENVARPVARPVECHEPDPEGVERRKKAVLEAKRTVQPWHTKGNVLLRRQLTEAIRKADEEGAAPPDPRDHPRPGEECKRGCGKKVHQGACKGTGWNVARREGPDGDANKGKGEG